MCILDGILARVGLKEIWLEEFPQANFLSFLSILPQLW